MSVERGRRAESLELDDFAEHAYEQGWTDGLPIVEPTPERVQQMLGRFDPRAVLGVMPPGNGMATHEAIAVNAVMAGCRPEHFRVVLAAVRASLDERFSLASVQSTTHPVTPAVLVTGPVARALDFNGGPNCFGPGNRSNAVVGRALRFCLLNVGYGTPGLLDMAMQGQPGKYSFCFAENDDASPWEPLHADYGFAADASCVTVFQAGGTINVVDPGSATADSLLTSVAGAMALPNHNNLLLGNGDTFVVFSPDHAEILGREGLAKDEVRRILHERARIPMSRFSEGLRLCLLDWRRETYPEYEPDRLVDVGPEVDQVQIAVAGGAGSHTTVIPSFGQGRTVSVEV